MRDTEMMIEKRKMKKVCVCVCVWERERERESDDTCCNYKSSCWEEQNYYNYKVEESQAIGAFEDISRPQYLSWYRFLGKMKLGIIFMKWVEWIMNLNNYDFLFLFFNDFFCWIFCSFVVIWPNILVFWVFFCWYLD